MGESEQEKYLVIADEIRNLTHDKTKHSAWHTLVTQALLGILNEISESNPGSVYAASKKYVVYKGLIEIGFTSVSDRFLTDKKGEFLVCPWDIVEYLNPIKIKTGDVVLTFNVDEQERFTIAHFRVLSFDQDGYDIEWVEQSDNKTYRLSQHSFIGKIGNVIRFDEPEWLELCDGLFSPSYISDNLSKKMKFIEKQNLTDKSKYIKELNRRLTIHKKRC